MGTIVLGMNAWPVYVSLAGIFAVISMLGMFFSRNLSSIFKGAVIVLVASVFGYLSGIIAYVMIVSPDKYMLYQTVAAITGSCGVTLMASYWLLLSNFKCSRTRAALGAMGLLAWGLFLVAWIHIGS